jgi:hypothetical protein
LKEYCIKLNSYNHDVRDNHTGGSAKIPSAVVGGPDPNNIGRGTATIKQRVAAKFRGEKDVGDFPWHVAESADQEYSASPQG